MSRAIGRYSCPHCGMSEALTPQAVMRHAGCAPDPRDTRIAELERENAKLRDENIALGGASTMIACTGCKRGVRPRYAVRGLCAECAAALIAKPEATNES